MIPEQWFHAMIPEQVMASAAIKPISLHLYRMVSYQHHKRCYHDCNMASTGVATL